MVDAMQRTGSEHRNLVNDDDVPCVQPCPLLGVLLSPVQLGLIESAVETKSTEAGSRLRWLAIVAK